MLCRTFLSRAFVFPDLAGIARGQSFKDVNPCFGPSESLCVEPHWYVVVHGLCSWVVDSFPPFLANSGSKSEVLQKSAHRKKIVLTKSGQTSEAAAELLAPLA